MSARALFTIIVSALVCLALMGRPALQDRVDEGAARDAQTAAAAPATTDAAIAPRAERPAILIPLYTSFVTLQALDIHSTLRAPQFGGREANPIVGGMLGSPAAFVAAKIGMTAGIYLVSERLWKRNKAASIATMIALDSVYAGIVAHNYAVEARARPTPRN
jgi:uncharacterized protein DUF5658